MAIRLRGDFNGLFGDLLCLSHSDVATDEAGTSVHLETGMEVVAFEEDSEDGEPCFLVACGRVVPSPEDLQHNGSRWSLQIDQQGVRHVAKVAESWPECPSSLEGAEPVRKHQDEIRAAWKAHFQG